MKISRRSVLHVSGLAAAALALTGCSASGSAALGGRLPGLLKGLLGKGEAAASPFPSRPLSRPGSLPPSAALPDAEQPVRASAAAARPET